MNDQAEPGLDVNNIFRVLYTNACSILNKLDELSSFVLENKPDFIAICETWGYGELSDCFFNIPGYEIVSRNDREDTTYGIGGGLLIYVRDELVGNVTEYTSEVLDNFIQSSAVRVRLESKYEVMLVLLYRPHHIYRDTVIQPELTIENNAKLCDLLHDIPKPYVIMGDLNYSNIDWQMMSSASGSSEFFQSAQDNFLSQHIGFSTHNSGTQPDVVLSSNSDIVVDVEDMCHLGSSDHSMIMVTLKGKIPSNVTYEQVSDWRNADLSLLRQQLESVDWTHLDNLNTLESWEFLKTEILKAEENCVPKKRRRTNSRPLWMQQNIIRTIRKKRRLWATYKRTNDYEEYLAYKKVERETKILVKQAKKKFEKKLAKEAKKKPKMFYSYLRSKTSNRTSVGPLKENNEVVSDDTEMANILNRFFSSVFTVENENLPEKERSEVPEMLVEVSFPENTILKKIHSLKTASACGPDKIGSRILQEAADVLCAPLSVVFTRSIQEGIVPDDWKRANITPIFKSGSKMTAGNYRPVSLTCIICKIMESIIRNAMITHFTQYD